VDEEVAKYLATGDSDPLFRAWPGHTLARCQAGDTSLRDALVFEVLRRVDGLPGLDLPANLDLDTFLERKLAPMVTGLFPERERGVVLSALKRGVCILTRDNLESVLRGTEYPETAWTLANIYLRAAGSVPLSDDAPLVVGLGEGTTSYVSAAYFDERDAFADFIVHEAAHVFHNCKRETIGLPFRKRQPWLLDIDYAKRETFAYACEGYARILELSPTPAARKATLGAATAVPPPPDERVDAGEYREILEEACGAQNGWTRILRRCAPRPGRAGQANARRRSYA
jgi:hypothetical protein